MRSWLLPTLAQAHSPGQDRALPWPCVPPSRACPSAAACWGLRRAASSDPACRSDASPCCPALQQGAPPPPRLLPLRLHLAAGPVCGVHHLPHVHAAPRALHHAKGAPRAGLPCSVPPARWLPWAAAAAHNPVSALVATLTIWAPNSCSAVASLWSVMYGTAAAAAKPCAPTLPGAVPPSGRCRRSGRSPMPTSSPTSSTPCASWTTLSSRWVPAVDGHTAGQLAGCCWRAALCQRHAGHFPNASRFREEPNIQEV